MSTLQSNLKTEGIGAAIGRIASGLFIVTAQDGDHRVGMLASWIQQLGFEPPCIAVAVHPDRELYPVIKATGRFTVNVLSNQNLNLLRAFSRYSPDQFDGVPCQSHDHGITLDDGVAELRCKVREVYPVADHHLVIADIEAGNILNADLEPMVHLRKSGFNY